MKAKQDKAKGKAERDCTDPVCTWHTHRSVEIVPDYSIFNLFHSKEINLEVKFQLFRSLFGCIHQTHCLTGSKDCLISQENMGCEHMALKSS